MNDTIYRKRGKKYEPIGEYDPERYDTIPFGVHLIVCTLGMKSWRYQIDPDQARLLAAAETHRDELAQWIVALSRPVDTDDPRARRRMSPDEVAGKLLDRLIEAAKATRWP